MLLNARIINREQFEEALSNRVLYGGKIGTSLIELGFISEEDLARKAEVIAPLLRDLDRAYRLPLVALAVPALKKLDEARRGVFLEGFRTVVEADQRITLSEFVLATILDWTLGPKARRAGSVRFRQCSELAAETALVLSLLAHAGAAAGGGVCARASIGQRAAKATTASELRRVVFIVFMVVPR